MYCRGLKSCQYCGLGFLIELEDHIPQVCLKIMLVITFAYLLGSEHQAPDPSAANLPSLGSPGIQQSQVSRIRLRSHEIPMHLGGGRGSNLSGASRGLKGVAILV